MKFVMFFISTDSSGFSSCTWNNHISDFSCIRHLQWLGWFPQKTCQNCYNNHCSNNKFNNDYDINAGKNFRFYG